MRRKRRYLSVRIVRDDLLELDKVVKGHEAHATVLSGLEVVNTLGRVGKDDLIGLGTDAEGHVDLTLAGTVEVDTKHVQEAHDVNVRARLDGVERLHARKSALPPEDKT